LIERDLFSRYHGNPFEINSIERYTVKTDELYRVQYGDHTIEVTGSADLIFDDVCIEGYSFWVFRSSDSANLVGYLYRNGKWIDVHSKG